MITRIFAVLIAVLCISTAPATASDLVPGALITLDNNGEQALHQTCPHGHTCTFFIVEDVLQRNEARYKGLSTNSRGQPHAIDLIQKTDWNSGSWKYYGRCVEAPTMAEVHKALKAFADDETNCKGGEGWDEYF